MMVRKWKDRGNGEESKEVVMMKNHRCDCGLSLGKTMYATFTW